MTTPKLKVLAVLTLGRVLLVPNPSEPVDKPESVLITFQKNGKWVIQPIDLDETGSLRKQLTPEVLCEYGYTKGYPNMLEELLGLLGNKPSKEEVETPTIEFVFNRYSAANLEKQREVTEYFNAKTDEKAKEIVSALNILSKYNLR